MTEGLKSNLKRLNPFNESTSSCHQQEQVKMGCNFGWWDGELTRVMRKRASNCSQKNNEKEKALVVRDNFKN